LWLANIHFNIPMNIEVPTKCPLSHSDRIVGFRNTGLFEIIFLV